MVYLFQNCNEMSHFLEINTQLKMWLKQRGKSYNKRCDFYEIDLKIDSFLVGNCMRIKNQTNSVKGLYSNVLKRTALLYKNQKFEHSYPKINYFS